MSLQLDFSKSPKVGESFNAKRANKHFGDFKKTIDDPSTGFFHLFSQKDSYERIQRVCDQFADRKTFVHIGIGGSSLGPEMLISALGTNGKQFIFINNIDSDEIHRSLESIEDLSSSLFFIVSKSGGTAETVAGLSLVAGHLKEKLGVTKEQYKDYFVFCTDPVKSELLNLGKELGISCLQVPSNVGGRFCVLSDVGLFPVQWAHGNARDLLEGARDISSSITDDDVENNPLTQLSEYIYTHYLEGFNQTILMPYSSLMRNFSFWFVQLWAESLGKKHSRNKEVVHTGLTPVPGYGATDQHSQMQLFMEGPKDKVLIMTRIQNPEHDYCLSSDFEIPSAKKLAPYTLNQLMKAELDGTLKALSEAQVPYIECTMTRVDQFNIGAMCLLFESLTAIMGAYLDIDPFDQPGVEAGKIYAYEYLTKAGQ